jgi:chemotaxis protein CheD
MVRSSDKGAAVTHLPTHYLYPSALFAPARPHIVTTILGTCVAVCLWDRKLKRGGINHYMLPLWNGEGLASPKYGNIAIEKLVEKMLSRGSRREDLVAKVFGGKDQTDKNSMFDIGRRNALLAEEMLKEYRIELIAKSLGGPSGRKILFHTGSGEVMLKYLGK